MGSVGTTEANHRVREVLTEHDSKKKQTYPTTVSNDDDLEFTIAADGKGLRCVFEVYKLLDVELWTEKAHPYAFTEHGQTTKKFWDLSEEEVTYDYNEASRDRIRQEFKYCLSLADAFRGWPSPNPERLKERGINPEISGSCIWQCLFRIEKLFAIERFHWVELAEQCCYIAELDMAGVDVKPMIAKVHQIISIWEEYLK